jgi:REP element-mobilizing transposase RayT
MQSEAVPIAFFITWTTYGTWLPGDMRGWRKRNAGHRTPQPKLFEWCFERLRESPVLLKVAHRESVVTVVRRHAELRRWRIHALSVRSNHVHIAIEADAAPDRILAQLKANASRVLRSGDCPLANTRIWTKGGYTEFVYTENDLEVVVTYINESQDNWYR